MNSTTSTSDMAQAHVDHVVSLRGTELGVLCFLALVPVVLAVMALRRRR